jgi:hypothetical protein
MPATLGRAETEAVPSRGIGPAAATAVAVATLVVGLVVGFFLGRAYDDREVVGTGAVGTIPQSPASPGRPPGDTVPQRPSPAPATPPATDLAPSGIGTLEEPIPAGQAYVLGLYEIEVRGVTRDATALLAEHDAANPAPPEGQQHVLVELAVRFTDAAGLGNPASIPFFVTDGATEWTMFGARCGRVPRPLAETGLLEQGDEALGNVCFTVASDAAGDLTLATESFAGPLYFALP